jgi:hypothetical protein
VTSSTGVVTGSFVTLHDDLSALASSGTPSNSAACATRAAERAADWERRRRPDRSRWHRVYRDTQSEGVALLSTVAGQVAVEDRGLGHRTEVGAPFPGDWWPFKKGLPLGFGSTTPACEDFIDCILSRLCVVKDEDGFVTDVQYVNAADECVTVPECSESGPPCGPLICGFGDIYEGNAILASGTFTTSLEEQYFRFKPTVTGDYCFGYYASGGDVLSTASLYGPDQPYCSVQLAQVDDYVTPPATVSLTAGVEYPVKVVAPTSFTPPKTWAVMITQGACTSFTTCSAGTTLSTGTVYYGQGTNNYTAWYRYVHPGGGSKTARITPTNGSNVYAVSYDSCGGSSIQTLSGTGVLNLSLGSSAATVGFFVAGNGDMPATYTVEII